MLMNKIVAFAEVTEEIEMTYSEGLHMRPIAYLNRIQEALSVKIYIKGKDALGETQTFSAEQLQVMSIGYPLDNQGKPNKITVRIKGENAALAMQEIKILMASNFGLKPVSVEVSTDTPQRSLVDAFNELKTLHPESKIVLENHSIAVSQAVSFEQ